MKRTLSLVVCSFLSLTAFTAGRTSDLSGAYVSSIIVDTLKQSAIVSLDQMEVPSEVPVKPRAFSGDGPMPISPTQHRPQVNSLLLDLTRESEHRAYQLLLAARDTSTTVDVTFAKDGALGSISIHRGPVVARAEGHLTVGALNNVSVEGVHYCLEKNVITVELSQLGNGGCESSRCGKGVSLTLDPANAADGNSFEALLSAYGNGSYADLGFDDKGDLTSVTLRMGFFSIVRPGIVRH